MAMASTPLPLSPRDLNRCTPTITEKKIGHTTVQVESSTAFQDSENLPLHTNDRSPSPSVIEFASPTVKSSSPSKQTSPTKVVDHQAIPLTEHALRENEGLTRAIQILEDDSNGLVDQNVDNDTISTIGAPQGYAGMDDTGFTTFSAVPNADMTLFARAGPSPIKSTFNSSSKNSRQIQYGDGVPTPRQVGRSTPATTRSHHFDDFSPSPTPRRPKSGGGDDSTNLILDFTEQWNAFTQTSSLSPSRSNRQSPRKFFTQPDLASYISGRRTPSPTKPRYKPSTPPESRHLPNLLDFDLTPAPTPRSVPSITARELESLKSSFLSQVSSLRATLSGKEAEVNSLKDAVTDAERRVGEALEQIRDEKGTKEILQAEKIEWEKRDKEMQGVLRNVKEEIIRGDRERDQLQQKFDDSERKREDAEAKAIEAQSKIAGLEAGSAAALIEQSDGSPHANVNSSTVEAAVEKVAKELHGLYRHKHEVKVAALKESYKARWERKIRELEARIDQLSRDNDDLRLGRDTTLSGVVPSHPIPGSVISQDQLDQERAEQAKILAGVQEEMASMRHNNTSLLAQLEKERLEMADLVAATEEMMQLSFYNPAANETSTQSTTSIDNLRGSISRAASGLKGPGFGTGTGTATGESRIGRMGVGGDLKARGGIGGTAGRSGIMGNIERMGRGRVGD